MCIPDQVKDELLGREPVRELPPFLSELQRAHLDVLHELGRVRSELKAARMELERVGA